MRLTSRLIGFLVLGIVGVTFVFARFQVRAEKRALRDDLGRRVRLLDESLSATVEPQLGLNTWRAMQTQMTSFAKHEELAGIAAYTVDGRLMAGTAGLARSLGSCPAVAARAMAANQGQGAEFSFGGQAYQVYAVPLHHGFSVAGALAVFDDASYIDAQTTRIWRDTLLHVLIQIILVVVITLLIVRWTIEGPIARMAQKVRAQRNGQAGMLAEADAGFLTPIAHEVSQLANSLHAARQAAEEEARLREYAVSMWTPDRLRVHVRGRLREGSLFVVSNREPYTHVHLTDSNDVKVVVPASGLVTALEPVLLACGGTWIAQGSGDADREQSDAHGRLRVPPDAPQYSLRRVFLSKEEENGYYLGFANEGLWPLCHIAYTRPTFRNEDWRYYQQVNQKFADAILEEIADCPDPLVLIQDYHFALLPGLVKQRRPDARVALFWHIPWPNPQVFGICPWERELLNGLLAADVVGFHIQAHCNHFLETVDDVLEARIEWDHFAVERMGHRTLVRPFPISVPMTEDHAAQPEISAYEQRARLFKRLGVQGTYLGIGVDRVDYTKGILERFLGVERFLERCPVYRGQFTFVQIGAPSRTEINRYAGLLAEVEAEAARVNARFETHSWKPIIFLPWHHSHQEIREYYQAADLCLVTSLHDGMNLVAKEFVAARSDECGVLILSRFAGAASELPDALIVNPYDIGEVATAIQRALQLVPEELHARMRRMRLGVREHNIYRWAANLIGALAEIRLDKGFLTLPEGPQSDLLGFPLHDRIPQVAPLRKM